MYGYVHSAKIFNYCDDSQTVLAMKVFINVCFFLPKDCEALLMLAQNPCGLKQVV